MPFPGCGDAAVSRISKCPQKKQRTYLGGGGGDRMDKDTEERWLIKGAKGERGDRGWKQNRCQGLGPAGTGELWESWGRQRMRREKDPSSGEER